MKNDLANYRAAGNTWTTLAELSGVTEPTISRAASGKNKTTYEIWVKLHRAAPEFIRDPMTGETGSKDSGNRTIPVVEIPVYKITAGGPRFTSGGKAVGKSENILAVPKNITDDNSFAVILPDDSMEPKYEKDSVAVVNPSLKLKPGKLCLAAFNDGRRLVRRYNVSKGLTLLEPLNIEYENIILDEQDLKRVRLLKIVFVGKSTI